MITEVRNVHVFENGLLSNDKYHEMEGISSSGLHYLHQYRPAKFKYGEREETAALEFGIASHAAVLEPKLFAEQFERDLSPDDFEECINNAKDAKSALIANGAIMTKTAAVAAMKKIGALTSDKDIKYALKDAGVKVPSGLNVAGVIELAQERLPDRLIITSFADMNEAAETLAKYAPYEKVYTGGDTAEDYYNGLAELFPHVHVFPNEVKAWHEKNKGKTMVKAESYDRIMEMRAWLFESEAAWPKKLRDIITGAYYETSVICEVKVEGYDHWIKVKVRPDLITKSCLVPDYKTDTDIRPDKFFPKAARLGYWFRQVFVTDVLSAVYGREFIPALIPQEKEKPYEAGLILLQNSTERDVIQEQREAYTEALITYSECTINDVWPGVYSEPLIAEYPHYL